MNATAKHTPPGYEVTRDGRVLSISSNWRGYGRRELAQTLNADGYPSVRIIVDGKRVRKSVHGLADNLAWGTRKENAEDRERHGRTSRGPSHSDAIKASNQANGTRAFRLAQGEANHV